MEHLCEKPPPKWKAVWHLEEQKATPKSGSETHRTMKTAFFSEQKWDTWDDAEPIKWDTWDDVESPQWVAVQQLRQCSKTTVNSGKTSGMAGSQPSKWHGIPIMIETHPRNWQLDTWGESTATSESIGGTIWMTQIYPSEQQMCIWDHEKQI